MNFVKQSMLAYVAWNVSSVVTIAQIVVAKAAFPEFYESTMDFTSRFLMAGWDFTVTAGGVLWEFFNFP